MDQTFVNALSREFDGSPYPLDDSPVKKELVEEVYLLHQRGVTLPVAAKAVARVYFLAANDFGG
jgi:hypothetical protein